MVRGHAQGEELAEVRRELDAAKRGLREGELGIGEAREDGHSSRGEVSENRGGGGRGARRGGGRRGSRRARGAGCRGAGGQAPEAGGLGRRAREAVRERRPAVDVDHCWVAGEVGAARSEQRMRKEVLRGLGRR